MSKEQIEEMAKVLCKHYGTDKCEDCWNYNMCPASRNAEKLYNAGYRKQSEGEWTKHLDEWDCEYAKCSCCGAEFYDSNGDDTITIDMFYKFCPECGARMKGGE